MLMFDLYLPQLLLYPINVSLGNHDPKIRKMLHSKDSIFSCSFFKFRFDELLPGSEFRRPNEDPNFELLKWYHPFSWNLNYFNLIFLFVPQFLTYCEQLFHSFRMIFCGIQQTTCVFWRIIIFCVDFMTVYHRFYFFQYQTVSKALISKPWIKKKFTFTPYHW